jgi:hypothetical protein
MAYLHLRMVARIYLNLMICRNEIYILNVMKIITYLYHDKIFDGVVMTFIQITKSELINIFLSLAVTLLQRDYTNNG